MILISSTSDVVSIELGISIRYQEAFFDRDLSVVIIARYFDTEIFYLKRYKFGLRLPTRSPYSK